MVIPGAALKTSRASNCWNPGIVTSNDVHDAEEGKARDSFGKGIGDGMVGMEPYSCPIFRGCPTVPPLFVKDYLLLSSFVAFEDGDPDPKAWALMDWGEPQMVG